MPSAASSINMQYGYTIGRGEQFGPGFSTPVFAARGRATSCTCSAVPLSIVPKAHGLPSAR